MLQDVLFKLKNQVKVFSVSFFSAAVMAILLLKTFLSQFSVGVIPASVIGNRLGVRPVLGKAVHLPRVAEKTVGPAIFRTLTLVICHGLPPHVCHHRGDADCSPSSPRLRAIERAATFFGSRVLGLFCVVAHVAQLAFRSAAIFSAK